MYRSRVGLCARLRVSADGEIHLNLPIPLYYLRYQTLPRAALTEPVDPLARCCPASRFSRGQCKHSISLAPAPAAKPEISRQRVARQPIHNPTRRQVRRRERPTQSRPRVCFTAIMDVRNEHRSFAHAEPHHSRVELSTSLSARLSYRCHELAYPKHPMPR
jgi:hypothetical protein